MKTVEVSSGGSSAEPNLRDIDELYLKIRASEAKIVGSDGQTRALPSNLYSFLCEVFGDLKTGKATTILQNNAELTTVEAAKLLSVSRQFLIQLLEQGQIPFHMVGTHRRVYAREVLAYRAKRDVARTKTLDDLVRAEMD